MTSTALKLMFYFSVTLALVSTLLVANDLPPLWILLAPVFACSVFLPDLLDYLTYGFLPHHAWTHHPISLVYFLPFVTITANWGIDVHFLLPLACGWGCHLLLDVFSEGIPLFWEPVYQMRPFRSYNDLVLNSRWILRFPRPWLQSAFVQRVGCASGLGWYLLVLISVVVG